MPLLDEDDIVVDGGNAHFIDTRRRQEACAEQGLHFVGMGVSEARRARSTVRRSWSAAREHAYERLRPVVESIAAVVDGTLRAHVGPDGAGHFVKMVHNGIEYADMQLIAESYDLLRSVLGLEPAEVADIFEEWNGGDLESFLIEMTADVLRHDAGDRAPVRRRRARRGGAEGHRPLDRAERPRARRAGDRHRRGDLRAVAVGPHRAARRRAQVFATDPEAQRVEVDRDAFVDQVRAALYASKVVAYAQGFDQIAAGAEAHGWDIDLGEVATIWRGGCIIRAQFLDRITEAYADEPELPTLLTTRTSPTRSATAWTPGASVVADGGARRRPDPGVLSSLAYFDGLRRTGCRRRSSRRSATTSARTPTSGSTATAPSTPGGPRTAVPRSRPADPAGRFLPPSVEEDHLADRVPVGELVHALVDVVEADVGTTRGARPAAVRRATGRRRRGCPGSGQPSRGSCR